MIYKIGLRISGDLLYPDSLIERINGNCLIVSKHSPLDRKFNNREVLYEFGSITFWHPNKFSTENNIIEYEEWFITFLLTNYQLFIEQNVEDVEFYIEAYHDNDQCNFAIFDKKLLKKISHIEVSFPVSTYLLTPDYYQNWANEIEAIWLSSHDQQSG